MKRKAVYPGSFDPVTYGHIDIIKRSLEIFDEVVIAVLSNPQKNTLFTVEERVSLLKSATKDIKGVSVDSFHGLLVDYIGTKRCRVIIRGLRVLSDFEYEFQMALMNRKLSKDIEIIYMMPNESYTYLSSTLIKEIAKLGGNVGNFVPSAVEKALKRKIL